MNHKVKFVSNNELSDEHPWVFVVQDQVVILLIRESAVSADTLDEAWDAFCQMVRERPALAA